MDKLTAGKAQHLARTHLYIDTTDLGTPTIRGWEALAYALDTETTPAHIDLDALERAFITYWKDFGDARHNLTAAVREYLRAVSANAET